MPDNLLDRIPDVIARNLALDAIAAQNDFFRKMVFQDESIGKWAISPDVDAKGPGFRLACIEAVRSYDEFTPDSDPYGERAMGNFTIEGETVWWSIHPFEQNCERDPRDPDRPMQPRRVLTILLPCEIGNRASASVAAPLS